MYLKKDKPQIKVQINTEISVTLVKYTWSLILFEKKKTNKNWNIKDLKWLLSKNIKNQGNSCN